MSTHLEDWERRLRTAFDSIDDYLEDKYGSKYTLRPGRPKRGSTGNKKYDGLFSVDAAYSAGYGSELGEGYVVVVRMSTVHTPKAVAEQIEEEVVDRLRDELPKIFPNSNLDVKRDGHAYKIIGDLALI